MADLSKSGVFEKSFVSAAVPLKALLPADFVS